MHLDDPRRFVARQPFQAPVYRGPINRPLAYLHVFDRLNHSYVLKENKRLLKMHCVGHDAVSKMFPNYNLHSVIIRNTIYRLDETWYAQEKGFCTLVFVP